MSCEQLVRRKGGDKVEILEGIKTLRTGSMAGFCDDMAFLISIKTIKK
jgi:hypothetical protein